MPLCAFSYASDGKLLIEAIHSNGFDGYGAVVLDDVHERTTATDYLMAMSKLELQKNPRFRVVIMSATLDKNTFQVSIELIFFFSVRVQLMSLPFQTYWNDQTSTKVARIAVNSVGGFEVTWEFDEFVYKPTDGERRQGDRAFFQNGQTEVLSGRKKEHLCQKVVSVLCRVGKDPARYGGHIMVFLPGQEVSFDWNVFFIKPCFHISLFRTLNESCTS